VTKITVDLAEKKIGSLLLSYYIPAFIGVMANALYNIVDRIFIGQGVGHIALSGISVVFPVMIIIMGFGMLIGIGAAVLTSIALGKKNRGRAEAILGNAFSLMIAVSIFVTLLGFTIKGPILQSFGATAATLQYADDYLNIILSGSIFGITGYGLNSIIRAEGNAKIAMVSMIISAALNIILDAVLIFVFDMGVKGAAYATIISQMVLTLWVILHFRRERSVIKLKLSFMRPDQVIIKNIFLAGMAPFVMQMANSFVQAVFNTQLIKHGGDIAVAAMGVANSVTTIIIMSIIALNMASQPIIGYNFGAKNYRRVKETWILTIKYSTYIALIAFAFIELFPSPVIMLFNNDPELLEKGTTGLRIFLLMLPLVGFQIVTGNYFQATGRSNIATLMTLMRQIFLLLPILIILPRYFGLKGVWMSAPLSDFLNAIIVLLLVFRYMKSLNNRISLEELGKK